MALHALHAEAVAATAEERMDVGGCRMIVEGVELRLVDGVLPKEPPDTAAGCPGRRSLSSDFCQLV